jgi:glycosyltransferase involved in cell wall biosynthesis
VRRVVALAASPARAVTRRITQTVGAYPFLLTLAKGRQLEPTGCADRAPLLVVMLVISEVWRDPRVEREARSLAAAGFRVKIVYPDFFSAVLGLGPLDWGEGIEFRPLPGHLWHFIGSFPYLLGGEFLKAVEGERPFAFHAHDLSTALIALAAARTAGAHCVCDFHEWYSENVTWSARHGRYLPHPWLKKLVYRLGELLVMQRASAVVTVCDSIADELRSGRYGTRRKVHVIRNIPPLSQSAAPAGRPTVRDEIGAAATSFVVLWQGGVGPTRLIEPIIEAFELIPRGILVIRGPAIEEFGSGYLELARAHGCGSRVFCLPPVPSRDVVAAAAGADAGIWSLPNLCKNFYYALPNKVFEYLAAGLPVLAADYPEVQRLVRRYEIGLSFDPYDPASIAAQVNRMIDEPGLVARLRANTPAALADMQADREWNKLVRVYHDLAAGVAT